MRDDETVGYIVQQKEENIEPQEKISPAPPRHTAAEKANSALQSKPLPKKQMDTGSSTFHPQDFYTPEPVIFQGQRCRDDNYDFTRPHPLTCRKCSLTFRWNEQNLRKYMGSFFEKISYQWTPCMDEKDIVSFSVSARDRPVFEASCDFAKLYML